LGRSYRDRYPRAGIGLSVQGEAKMARAPPVSLLPTGIGAVHMATVPPLGGSGAH